ncbi:MAG: insulinase family protein [Bacteroidetes bacterium]|nr:insulinase family protein [Bacteroidota bacterium]
MSKFFQPIAFVFAMMLSTVSIAQTKEIEKVEAKPGELKIGYTKYQLSNGLTIIIHEDHSDPLVHVNVAYHVGSAREVKDRSGFAHFFEHMLFQGSEHVADEEHMHLVDAAGGSWNGNTTRDRTKYFETVPSNYVELALYLEADRMGFVLDSVTQKKFEVQRATVKNEKGQNVENVPYGMEEEIKNKLIYPFGHPYSWTTIGYTEDLDRATLEDMKNFFLRWYGPNNACLIVAGDVNTADVLKYAEKYFGSIPRCPEVKKMKMDPVIIPENKYAYYEDKIAIPVAFINYVSVPLYHPDEPALDILGQVLGSGKNSYLYKHFELTENTLGAYSNNSSDELAGEFTVTVPMYPATSPDSVELWLNQTYEDLEKNGVSDDALLRAKASLETSYLGVMESNAGKANYLGDVWLYAGKSMNLNDDLDRYRRVTKEDVIRVFNKYVKSKKSAWVIFQPKGTNAADNEKKSTSTANAAPVEIPNEYKGLVYNKAKDNFDRNVRPTPTAAKPINLPEIWKDKFDNGLVLMGTEYKETPFVTLSLKIKGGELHELNAMDKIGITSFTASMMNEGTQKHTAEEFENIEEKLGSSVSIRNGGDALFVTIRCHVDKLDDVLKLMEERLFMPKFDEKDFKRLKKQEIENVRNLDYNAGAIADAIFDKFLYGNTIYGVQATAKSLKKISIDDVKAYYNNYLSPSVSELTVVGPISKETILSKITFLKNWQAKAVTIPSFGDFYETEKTKIYFYDRAEAPQSEIRVGYITNPISLTGESYKCNIMNFQLGGNFNSRLNQNIRETRGYTYGIRGGFTGNKEIGSFQIGTGVKSSTTDTALSEIFREMNDWKAGKFTEDDLTFTKSSLSNSYYLRYETGGQKLNFLNTLLTFNVPYDYYKQQLNVINSFTMDDMKKYAATYLPTDKMVVVIVGDKATLKKRIDALKIGPIEMISDYNAIPFNASKKVKFIKKD